MDSMILILIATCIFLPCMIYQYRKKKTPKGRIMQLHQAEAGPTRRRLFKQKINLMPMVEVDMGNISINPELQYFVVKNQCMQIKGISDGDVIGVRMIENGDSIPTISKGNHILLIYLNDENFKGYKIREQGEITNDGTAYNTYHYENGRQHKSSKPHSIDSIKGIVTEIHQRQYIGYMN